MANRPTPRPYNYHFASPAHSKGNSSPSHPQHAPFFPSSTRISFNYHPQCPQTQPKITPSGAETERISTPKEGSIHLARKYTFSLLGKEQPSLNRSVSTDPQPPQNSLPRQHMVLSRKGFQQPKVKPIVEMTEECELPKTPRMKAGGEMVGDTQSTERKSEAQELQGKVQQLIGENERLRESLERVRREKGEKEERIGELEGRVGEKGRQLQESNEELVRMIEKNMSLKEQIGVLKEEIQKYREKRGKVRLQSCSLGLKVEPSRQELRVDRQQGNIVEQIYKQYYQQVLKMFQISIKQHPNYHDLLISQLGELQLRWREARVGKEEADRAVKSLVGRCKRQEIDLGKMHHTNLVLTEQLSKHQKIVDNCNAEINSLNLLLLENRLKGAQAQGS